LAIISLARASVIASVLTITLRALLYRFFVPSAIVAPVGYFSLALASGD
jgi:hypothetical protein